MNLIKHIKSDLRKNVSILALFNTTNEKAGLNKVIEIEYDQFNDDNELSSDEEDSENQDKNEEKQI